MAETKGNPWSGLSPLSVLPEAGGPYAGLSIVDLILRAFGANKPLANPPVPASPAAPVVTPPLFDATVPTPPRVGTRMPIPGAAPSNLSVGIPTAATVASAVPNLLPTAPVLPTPPQMAVPPALDIAGIRKLLETPTDTTAAQKLLAHPGADFSRAQRLLSQKTDTSPLRAMLEKLKPDANANLANVLGGLAAGTATVDATSPGSFARALAQMGAGGLGGLAKSGTESREYGMKRAGVEFDLAKLASSERLQEAGGLIDIGRLQIDETLKRAGGLLDVGRLQSGERGTNITGNLSLTGMQSAEANQRNEIAFKNALSVYDTTVKNALTQYQQKTEAQKLLMPKVQHDANGITIQRIDPATGKLDVQFHSTKTVLDQAEKIKPLLEALNLPGPAAEAEEAKFVMNSFPDPTLKQEALKNLAVRRTIAAGAGGTVFGPLYKSAVDTATKQLQTENPTLVAKPEIYQSELNSRIASIIMADARVHNLAWTKYAAPHSVAARLIADALLKATPAP